jgi:transcriptional regulator with XRE-family HTH domain
VARRPRTDAEREFGAAFSRLLKDVRAAQGKSARDVARATDLSTDNIYAIERGDVLSPGIYTAHLLAREYGADLNELASNALSQVRASDTDTGVQSE